MGFHPNPRHVSFAHLDKEIYKNQTYKRVYTHVRIIKYIRDGVPPQTPARELR